MIGHLLDYLEKKPEILLMSAIFWFFFAMGIKKINIKTSIFNQGRSNPWCVNLNLNNIKYLKCLHWEWMSNYSDFNLITWPPTVFREFFRLALISLCHGQGANIIPLWVDIINFITHVRNWGSVRRKKWLEHTFSLQELQPWNFPWIFTNALKANPCHLSSMAANNVKSGWRMSWYLWVVSAFNS